MSRLLLVETSAQAEWVSSQLAGSERGTLVAVTAEAVEALDARGLAFIPAGQLCDLRQLAEQEYAVNVGVQRLARSLETFVENRCPHMRVEGPGFVSGQGYPLFHAAVAIAARAMLCIGAVRALDVDAVALFDGPLDPWFADDGYERAPWIDIVRHANPAVAIDTLPTPPAGPDAVMRPALSDRLRHRLGTTWRRAMTRNRAGRPDAARSPDVAGLRLLFPCGAQFDWIEVADALRSSRENRVVEMEGEIHGHFWPYAFVPAVTEQGSGRQELGVSAFAPDREEEHRVGELFDQWVHERPEESRFPIGRLDLFPGLARHFSQVARRSPALLRHADLVAAAALDHARPDAVCFFAMPWLAVKRFAYVCRRRSVPVVCYQHGAPYGTHRLAQHAQIEQAHADVFLTYGEGTREHAYPEFPSQARFVPVGSARIEAMRRDAPPARRPRSRLRVLWVGEYATGNAFNATHTLEDTRRYALEQEGLRLLAGSSSLHVTYRPHRHQLQEVGTVRWIHRACPAIAVEAVRPLERLIADADVIVTDTSSGQVWYEALGIGRPLILFCDPRQSLLWPEFECDLQSACLWYRNEPAFFEALRRLAEDPADVMSELRAINSAPFVRKYILHEGDGRPVDRVRRFLSSLHGDSPRPRHDLVKPIAS